MPKFYGGQNRAYSGRKHPQPVQENFMKTQPQPDSVQVKQPLPQPEKTQNKMK